MTDTKDTAPDTPGSPPRDETAPESPAAALGRLSWEKRKKDPQAVEKMRELARKRWDRAE